MALSGKSQIREPSWRSALGAVARKKGVSSKSASSLNKTGPPDEGWPLDCSVIDK